MKENGSLVWDDSDKVYYDYEAYEQKWNTVNNKRTRNNEGYAVKGANQYSGFYGDNKRSKIRSKAFTNSDTRVFVNKSAPLTISALSKDSLVWNHTYYDQINNTVIDKDYQNETFKDPKVSMRGRKRGR